MTQKTTAHFVNYDNLAASPPNRAIIESLIEMGYHVDIYGPGENFQVSDYGNHVSTYQVNYSVRWIIKNLFKPKWCRYSAFSATSEDPLNIMGLLSFVWRKPSFSLVDEIKSGAYIGNRNKHWKKIARWSIRKSDFQIVNDECRKPLLEDYLDTRDLDILVYPGCYDSPPQAADRTATRQRWGFSDSDLIVADSGYFYTTHSAPWLFHAFSHNQDIRVVLQALNINPIARLLLEYIEGRERLYAEIEQLPWRTSWAQMASADIGVAVYRQPGPQFQNMGISSNRLCMFLAMGVPVIVSKQPSFKFLEHYNCGILVENEDEFLKAIDKISSNLDQMKSNALSCTQEYINAPKARSELKHRLQRMF